jgi:SAM-dependent methyltransferase
MFQSESSQDILHLPDHATSCKLSEFTIPTDILHDDAANVDPEERAAVGGGFVVVNMYGNFSISVGRIDIGILSESEIEEEAFSKTNNTPFWESDGDALNHVRQNANSASNKCTAADMKMGGCGIVLYFTKAKYDTSGNRKILMNCLAKELATFQLTRLLCLPGTGVSLVDLRYLRDSYGGSGDGANGNKNHQRTASYDEEKKIDEFKPLSKQHRSPSFFEVTKMYDTPIPKLMLPTASAASLPTTSQQQDITAKFAAYSALGAISTLSLAKGWTTKQTNKQANHHRVLPLSAQEKKQGNKPKKLCQVVLLGLTSASAELYQLLSKDGRYDVSVADSKGVPTALALLGLNWSVPVEKHLDFKQALTAPCNILMACTWVKIPTFTADVVEDLQCQAFLTLSDNALPTDIEERESSFITFATKGLFDMADGVCDLGAYAKLYSLSREKNNDESAVAMDSHTFTVTDSYQMGVKVMEKAIHLDSIVQQYDMEEKHQFYSMILEKDELLDEINGAHLGLGTIIGNSSDRMTEWMWNKTKAMCPAMRTLQNERAGRSSGGAKTQINYVDLGAGSGAAARWICSQDSNIHVKCLNVSPKQNAENRQLSDESGLGGQISVETGTFERLPPEYEHYFDGCLSQDSFLHAFDKLHAFEEALRVTKGGGWLMISDLMCGEDQDITSEELNSFVKENVVTSWVS